MAQDRDAARVRVAREGLTQLATERISRRSFTRLPITMVDRARVELLRFFSDAPWTPDDDAGLAVLVGSGEGWAEEELAPGIRIGFGWRAGAFTVMVEADATVPLHDRTLGDTYEDITGVEGGRNPAELRFTTGPGTTRATGRFTRTEQGNSAAIAALFREFDAVETVRIDPGVVAVTLDNAVRWRDILLGVFDTITEAFVPPRVMPPDRQFERAVQELGALDIANAHHVARIVDAATSPDTTYRRVAVTLLETADAAAVEKPWGRALEDTSRAVRRAALRAMAHAAREDLRLFYERALNDNDPCVRYYAIRGLAQIGIGRAEQSIDKRRRDDDARVRVGAQSAYEGRVPQ